MTCNTQLYRASFQEAQNRWDSWNWVSTVYIKRSHTSPKLNHKNGNEINNNKVGTWSRNQRSSGCNPRHPYPNLQTNTKQTNGKEMRSIKIKVSKELTSSSPAATLFLYYLLLQASLSKPLCKPHQNTLLYSPGPPLLQQKNLPPERIPLPLFSKPAKKNLTPFQNILHFLPCFCLP